MKIFYKQLILLFSVLTIFSTTSYSNDEGLCAALDLTLTQMDCADNGGGVLPVFNLNFSISGGCFVDDLFWQVDGGGYTSANLPAAGLTVYDGEGINLINTTPDAFYEIYYILDDGTQSDVFTWNNGNCTGAVPGCMNVFATNYDVNATVDDGTCIYDETICDCLGNEHTLGVMTWVGDGFADQGEYTWDGLAVDFDCATWGYDCGDIDGSPTDDPNNVCLGQLPPDNGCEVLVCTADNMEIEQVTCQDDGNGLLPVFNMTFTIGGDCYVDDLYWQIDGGGFVFANLPAAGYDIFNGDGISLGSTTPDATYEIYYILSNGTQSATYTWVNGNCESEILGCTNEYATNYNANATAEDGTCTYDETICDCIGNEHTIGVLTWVGDGFADQSNYNWDDLPVNFDCATWGYDCGDIDGSPTDDPNNVCQGDLPPNNGCEASTCTADNMDIIQVNCVDDGGGVLQPSFNMTFTIGGDCFVTDLFFQVDGGGYTSIDLPAQGFTLYDGDDISLINTTPDGTYELYFVLDDGAQSAVYTWVNGNCDTAISGCTNEFATNYNPAATAEDGSCVYDETICDCLGNEHTIGVLTWVGDGFADQGGFNWDDLAVDFDCATWGYDCGDIVGSPTDDPNNVCGGDLPPNNGCEAATCTADDLEFLQLECADNNGEILPVFELTFTIGGDCYVEDLFWQIDGGGYVFANLPDAGFDIFNGGGIGLINTVPNGNYEIYYTLSDGTESAVYTWLNGNCTGDILGCMDNTACNYNAEATVDNGTCDFTCYGCIDDSACNFDPEATISDDSCEFESCAGCMDIEACNYDAEATIADDSCDFSCYGCIDDNACNFDEEATISDDSCEYESCAGCMDDTACNYDMEATLSDDSCDYSCYGCMDEEACNYDMEATLSDDSCDFSCYGCLDETACNYNSEATIDDESCEFTSCVGCTDQAACNYSPEATIDDESCEYESCLGCIDNTACNFDPEATIDDNSCEYVSCAGCIDSMACNFDPEATLSDESCEYETCAGCLDSTACNYNPDATLSDDSCEYETCAGCTDDAAINYNATATLDDGSCIYDCEYPTISYEPYCSDTDYENYYIAMTITDLGNGSPYTVSNNQNTDEIALSFNGTINLGPFLNGQDVLITTSSDVLAGCFLTSPVLNSDCAVGIDEIENYDFEIYPNPNSGEFVLATNEISGMTMITCYDLTGREVYRALEMLQSNSETSIKLNKTLAKGSYLLKLGNGKALVVKKLIIR